MNAKQFGRAVVPVILTDVALERVDQLLLSNGAADWLGLLLAGVSLLILPVWAGSRVSRVTERWYWWCLAALCVLGSTALLILSHELRVPTLSKMPPMLVGSTFTILMLVYALLGFIGGKYIPVRRNYEA